MRKPRRLIIAAAAAVAVAVGGVALTAPTASADVAGTFATPNLGSDPHIIGCTDPSTGNSGYCLYTSQDMGQQYAYPRANYYPMRDTKVYFSQNGHGNWVDKGTVFTESMLDSWAGRRTDCVASGTERVAAPGDVPGNCRAYHLWAPSVVYENPVYYMHVPDVSHTSDTGTLNVHNSSRIAVATSLSPFGPFTYQGTVDHSSGYMSDPHAVLDQTGDARYLFWADGDNDTCGGFKSAKLNGDWRTIQAGTTQSVVINGAEVLGSCDPRGSAGPIGRPYMEGASVYKRLASSSGLPLWTMVFAAKPMDTPTECNDVNAIPDSAQSDNEVIAWASATSAQGPYTYQGIIMCGSTTEWTNQATITTVVVNGLAKKIIIYHDSPESIKQRKLHAECLYYGSGHIAGVYRQNPANPSGFNECIASSSTGTWLYKGLWGQDPQFPNKPPIMSPTNGNGDIMAQRYAVGPWERYKFELVSGNTYVIRTRATGNLLCAPNSSTPIKAGCTSSSDVKAQFILESAGSWSHFRLKSVQNGNYVSIAGNGKLYTSAVDIGTAATFAPLSPTGG